MRLHSFHILNFRNLQEISFSCAPRLNIFHGNNGAGKTSVLEGLYYLGMGRSFRARSNKTLIQHDQESFSLSAKVAHTEGYFHMGVSRAHRKANKTRLNEEDASMVELTKRLPLRFLHADTRLSLIESSKVRRQLIDWGVFHVEPLFYTHWQRAHKLIKQRNAALKKRSSRDMVRVWEKNLAVEAHHIHSFRKNYLSQFQSISAEILSHFLPTLPISIQYHCGWDLSKDLSQLWDESWEKDCALGYTQYGPHRGDLEIKFKETWPAHQMLSQGQQKLLAYALYLAQGIFLKKRLNKTCLYLLDDLPGELDVENRRKVLDLLIDIQSQVFMTGIAKDILCDRYDSTTDDVFEVKDGKLHAPYSDFSRKEGNE